MGFSEYFTCKPTFKGYFEQNSNVAERTWKLDTILNWKYKLILMFQI